MLLKIKRLYADSILPTRAHATDAGLDLYCHRITHNWFGGMPEYVDTYLTGVAVEIPAGYVGLLLPVIASIFGLF